MEMVLKKVQPHACSKLLCALPRQSVCLCSFSAVICQEEQPKGPYCMKYSQSAFVCGGWLSDPQVYVNRLQFWQVPFMLNEGRKKSNIQRSGNSCKAQRCSIGGMSRIWNAKIALINEHKYIVYEGSSTKAVWQYRILSFWLHPEWYLIFKVTKLRDNSYIW